MEIEELKAMWQQYDHKLNNLEKLNKRLVLETLAKKPQRKIFWHKTQRIVGLIAAPTAVLVFIYLNLEQAPIGWKFIAGCVFMLSVLIYMSVFNIKSYVLLRGINLRSDSIVASIKKVSVFNRMQNNRWKHAFVYFPVFFGGLVLIIWDHYTFNAHSIFFLVVLFVATYILNVKGPMSYHKRSSQLEKDLLEMKEYTD